MTIEWKIPQTAPKDGTPILAVLGWPWPVMAVWDEYSEDWSYMMLAACPMENGKTNSYWELESAKHCELVKWSELPETAGDL